MGLNTIWFCMSNGVYLLLTLVMKTVIGALYTKHCTGSYCPGSLLLVWSVGQILGWVLLLVAYRHKSCVGSKGLIVVLFFLIIATIIVSFLGLVNTVPQLEVKTCDSNASQITHDQSVRQSCDINLYHYVAITVFGLDVLHVIVASLVFMKMRALLN